MENNLKEAIDMMVEGSSIKEVIVPLAAFRSIKTVLDYLVDGENKLEIITDVINKDKESLLEAYYFFGFMLIYYRFENLDFEAAWNFAIICVKGMQKVGNETDEEEIKKVFDILDKYDDEYNAILEEKGLEGVRIGFMHPEIQPALINSYYKRINLEEYKRSSGMLKIQMALIIKQMVNMFKATEEDYLATLEEMR